MEEEKTRVYLIRHGQVINHNEMRFNGHSDVDITSLGIEQMKALAEYLSDKDIAGIYSSDLLRALRGVLIIADKFAMRYSALKDLREVNMGSWEGLSLDEVKKFYPDQLKSRIEDIVNYTIPGGENLITLSQRVFPAYKKILDTHRGKSIVIVSHSGPNRIILCNALNLELKNLFRFEQDYGCLNIIDYYKEIAVVKLLNWQAINELRH